MVILNANVLGNICR